MNNTPEVAEGIGSVDCHVRIFCDGDFAILEYGDGSPLEECMVLESETVPGMGLHYRVDVRGEGIIRWVPAHALRKLEAADVLEPLEIYSANDQGHGPLRRVTGEGEA